MLAQCHKGGPASFVCLSLREFPTKLVDEELGVRGTLTQRHMSSHSWGGVSGGISASVTVNS